MPISYRRHLMTRWISARTLCSPAFARERAAARSEAFISRQDGDDRYTEFYKRLLSDHNRGGNHASIEAACPTTVPYIGPEEIP